MASPNKEHSKSKIADNRRAGHDYILEDRFEAGLVLQGWEVKGLREGKGQIKEGYVLIRQGEAWLVGAHITPPSTVSTHITPDPTRSRKLLLTTRELQRLIGATERKGYTLVPVRLYWKAGRYAKIEIALAKGKQTHDKRASAKDKEWTRDRDRLLKKNRL